jgi:hypothetical protein
MVKIENCCKIVGIDASKHPIGVVYVCNRNPIEGFECKHRPMVNVSGDWCDNIQIAETLLGEMAVCKSICARLEALDQLSNSLFELKKSMMI